MGILGRIRRFLFPTMAERMTDLVTAMKQAQAAEAEKAKITCSFCQARHAASDAKCPSCGAAPTP
jgi:rubrerythrin